VKWKRLGFSKVIHYENGKEGRKYRLNSSVGLGIGCAGRGWDLKAIGEARSQFCMSLLLGVLRFCRELPEAVFGEGFV